MNNQSKNKKPPKIAEYLMSRMFPDDNYFTTVSDLDEDYKYLLSKKGKVYAGIWYRLQLFPALVYFLTINIKWGFIMIKNYLKTALRNISKSKTYFFINITGLALGLACCILILLYVKFEFGYDTYHKDVERVFRVGLKWKGQNATNYYAHISWPAARELGENFPQVEYVGRLRHMSFNNPTQVVKYENKIFYENYCFYATSDIFKILTIPFIEGDSEAPFDKPGTILLTKRMAEKYFGEISAVGKIINVGNRDFEIIGVIADPPDNTHFKYNFIATMMTLGPPPSEGSWGNIGYFTYLKLLPDVNYIEFEELISDMADRYDQEFLKRNKETHEYFLQPVRDIHLYSGLRRELEPPGNPNHLYILSTVAVFILMLSCMNFICLSTAISRKRAKEVGIRKVAGARRLQLIIQFITESYFNIVFAAICAFIIALSVLPYFNNLIDTKFTIDSFFQPGILIIFSTLILVTCIGAGSYPAFLLSSFKPEKTIKNISGSLTSKSYVRKILVTAQYVISISLIIWTTMVYMQNRFMKKHYLGFDKEQKLVIPLKGNMILRDNSKSILSEFTKYNSITGAALSSNIPGRPGLMTDRNFIRLQGDNFENKYRFNYFNIDFDFLSEYKLSIVAGRPFQIEKSSDASSSIILNESGAKELGFNSPEDALGRKIERQRNSYKIVGIVKDFHYSGLKSQIEPFFFVINPYYKYITFTLSTEDLNSTIKFIDTHWRRVFPDVPFEYFFLDEDFDQQYSQEEKTAWIVSVFSLLSLIITCLGIFGLTAYTVEQQTREIGIRKVLGSSVKQIIGLLYKDLVKWTLFANIIAWPVAWYFIAGWLQNFHYRIETDFRLFFLAGAIVFAVSILSMSYKTIKAATANPVDSLRDE